MSILQSGIEYLVPKGRFEEIRATAPDRATYNIEATRDLVNNVPLFASPFTPVGIAGLSLPYDFAQASKRARDTFFENNPTSFGIVDDAEIPIGPSMVDFASAVAAENPIDSLIERTKGATIGLADRLARAPKFLNNLFFTSAYAPEVTEDERKSIERQLPSFRSLSNPEDYEGPEREGILRSLLNKGKDIVGNISDKIPNFGIMGLLKNLDNFKNLSPLDRQFILEQAGGNRPMKDAFGYNIRSARGNYADLVSRRAQIARNRALFKQPLRAIDLYYQKKEAERAAKDRAILDAEFAAGRGGSGQDFTGGRYDGAPDAATYSAEPTAYSGSS